LGAIFFDSEEQDDNEQRYATGIHRKSPLPEEMNIELSNDEHHHHTDHHRHCLALNYFLISTTGARENHYTETTKQD
jgi:hypothetical protein